MSFNGGTLNLSSIYNDELREVQNKIPFDIFLGLQENEINGLEKQLMLGLKVKL